MKLVDILARELKVWPEGVSKLTQSFAGMVFYQDSAQQIVPLGRMEISDDFRDEYVTRAEWQAAVDEIYFDEVRKEIDAMRVADPGGIFVLGNAVYRQHKQPEWSEDGLPNVGTKCVVYKGTHEVGESELRLIGPAVTVTARFKSSRGNEVVAVDGGPDLGCGLFRADMCFHLPAAEEIERTKECDKIYGVLIGVERQGNRSDMAEALYDAGYRKQVTK